MKIGPWWDALVVTYNFETIKRIPEGYPPEPIRIMSKGEGNNPDTDVQKTVSLFWKASS